MYLKYNRVKKKKNKQTPKCRANEIHCQFYKLFLLMCWPNFEKGVFFGQLVIHLTS